jgi:hypothetical protein
MQRWIMALALIIFGTTSAFAGLARTTLVDGATENGATISSGSLNVKESGTSTTTTAINAQLLDDSPTLKASTGIATGGYNKTSIYWTYDETEVGASISAALTVEVSYDNSVWLAATFYDVAGGATAQASETLSADGSYYCWLPDALVVPYVRVTVTATNTDVDDTLLTTVKVVGKN